MKKWNFTVSKFVVFMLLAVLLTGCGLKEKKAVTAGSVVAPVTGTVGIKMNVTSPENVNEIYIERKEASEPDTKWKQVGFRWYGSPAHAESSNYEFTDYFYERGKSYKYRARFETDDWNDTKYIDIGSITTVTAGWQEMSFSPAPQLSWNSSERTLSITNEPHLVLPEDDAWSSVPFIGMSFTYSVPDEAGQEGAWPYYGFDCEEPHYSESWNEYGWDDASFGLNSIFVDVYLEESDEGINPRLTICDTSNGMNIGSIPSWAIANLN